MYVCVCVFVSRRGCGSGGEGVGVFQRVCFSSGCVLAFLFLVNWCCCNCFPSRIHHLYLSPQKTHSPLLFSSFPLPPLLLFVLFCNEFLTRLSSNFSFFSLSRSFSLSGSHPVQVLLFPPFTRIISFPSSHSALTSVFLRVFPCFVSCYCFVFLSLPAVRILISSLSHFRTASFSLLLSLPPPLLPSFVRVPSASLFPLSSLPFLTRPHVEEEDNLEEKRKH